jgi:hypothetical protein
MIILIWLLNYGISWLNCYSVSRSWLDAKAHGGWPRFMCWCGAGMAACGFTWCYMLLALFGANQLGYIDEPTMILGCKMGYLVLAPSIVGIGIFITVDSWVKAYRDRSFASIGTAAWNTYAQISNTVDMVQNYGGVIKDVGEAFGGLAGSGDDDDSDHKGVDPKILLLLIGILVGAAFLGIVQTYFIIRAGIASQAREIAYQRKLASGPEGS